MNTLNSKTSPSESTSLMPSFQSNCSCLPGGVSNRGCGSRPPTPPKGTSRARHHAVKAPYPGSPSPRPSRRNAYTAILVIPGSWAFARITSSSGSKALPLADLPSAADSPSRQYLATVCRSMPCLLAISLKFGFAPDPL